MLGGGELEHEGHMISGKTKEGHISYWWKLGVQKADSRPAVLADVIYLIPEGIWLGIWFNLSALN